MRVQELMTRDVIRVTPSTSLKDVGRILRARHVSGGPVIDASGKLLGIVSEGDILCKEAGPEPKLGRALRWLVGENVERQRKLAARTAGEAMTSPAICIGPERPVAQAARTMIDSGVNRLPVVDEGGALVGIVTRADLLRAFARGDSALVREIREDVVAKSMWISPDRVQVSVEAGEVNLSGRVERKSDADLLVRLVERVPGVVSVSDSLEWEYDEQGPGRHANLVEQPA